MKPFELSEQAVVLGARNANDILKAISAKLLNATVRFGCNVNTGHTNRIVVVMRWQHAIELMGVDDVTYRIPFGARIEIDDLEIRVEMRNAVPLRRNRERIRWLFVVNDNGAAVGIRSDDGTPPNRPAPKLAWPIHEEDWLRIAAKMHLEVEVGA
jgi:hypothetical protein